MVTKISQEAIRVKNITQGEVINRPQQMYAWPGMVKISKDEIIVAASERRHHTCPYGREVIVRSTDRGHSWSLPQEVYNSELDDRDSNLAILPDGTIILSWFSSTAFENRWIERGERVTKKMRDELVGTWMCCSKDFGETWGQPSKMPVGTHISPIPLSDSSLISIGDDGKEASGIAVYKSYDQGKNWSKISVIPCLKKFVEAEKAELFYLDENHVLETSPGKLIAMFRSENPTDRYLRQAFSNNYGETWSIPEKTEIWGYPPQLLLLENSVIMCSYSHRRAPFSIRAVFSYDEGRTWDIDNIATLYEWEDEPDMGYPTSVELSSGKILTVFYCSRSDANHSEQTQRMDGNSPEGILSVTFTLENV